MNKKIALVLGALILAALVLGVASVYRGTPVEKSIAGKGANAPSVAARSAPNAPSPDQTGPVAYLQPCVQPCTGPLFRVIEMPKPCDSPCFVLERVESGDPADCGPNCFVIAETAQDCNPQPCAYVIRLTEPGLSFDDIDGWLPCQDPCRYVIEPVAAGSGQ